MRTHPKVLVPAIALTIAGTAAAAAVSFFIDNTIAQLAIWGLWLLAWCVLAAPRFYRWATTVYTLSNTEVSVRTGLIWTKRRSMRIDRIISIDIEQGLLDRIVGCGTLRIADASSSTAFLLNDVPHVEHVHDRLRGASHSV